MTPSRPRPANTARRTVARRPRRPRPLWVLPVVVLLSGVLMAGALLVGLRSSRAGALPGTTVGGVDIGGLDAPALLTAVEDLGEQRRARQLEAVRGSLGVPSTADEIGYVLDGQATVDAVLELGRQANPVAALRDQIRATFTSTPVAPVETFDETTFQRWLDRISVALDLRPLKGDIRIAGTAIEVIEPDEGETIDVPALRAAALAALADTAVARIEVPITTAVPTPSTERLAAIAAEAQRATSGPVTLVRREVQLVFTSEQIGELLEVQVQPRSGSGEAELVLAVDHEGVTASITAGQFAALNQAPQDATFAIAGERAQLIPAIDGFRYDSRAAARQLLTVATSPGPRSATLEGQIVEPTLATEQAVDLGIFEQVASFTTDHPCCQGRVQNIQRMADMVEGTIVRPGQTFSLNATAGERTAANGFVDGGAIQSGEFVEELGGGVSQFATTLFNAIFFGGYAIGEFRPHSYYLSRYPLGREATLNFDPPIDLTFTNDSRHGIYIHTAHTDTSITVALYSTRFAEVTTTTSDRYGFREPREEREFTAELPEGDERVLQSGREGFSVDFTREIAYVDGRTSTENYTTNYLPEPRIIEVGTARPGAPVEAPTTPAEPDPPPPPPAPAPPPPAPAPAPPAPAPAPPAPAPAPPPPVPPPPAPAPAPPPPAPAPPPPAPAPPPPTAPPDPPEPAPPEDPG